VENATGFEILAAFLAECDSFCNIPDDLLLVPSGGK